MIPDSVRCLIPPPMDNNQWITHIVLSRMPSPMLIDCESDTKHLIDVMIEAHFLWRIICDLNIRNPNIDRLVRIHHDAWYQLTERNFGETGDITATTLFEPFEKTLGEIIGQ